MQVQVQKWGERLALPIPQTVVDEKNIKEGTLIDLSFDDGKLLDIPIVECKYSLAELLANVTNENLHAELDTGKPVGREAW